MAGSLWRYSHFLLAAVSAVFLLLASVTGAILAVEPVTVSLRDARPVDIGDVYLSETIRALKETYPEVLELEVSPEEFVMASVFTEDGESETIYVHPRTGAKLGEVPPRSPFFSSVTNLHRSLFLKGLGRAFVGVVSLLLCFIAVTGVFLLAQRQGGFRKWFTKVQETDFGQRYHVILSRWLVVPILVVAFTGAWLSAEKFALLPEEKLEYSESISEDETEGSFFETVRLNEVRSVLFPFSDDPEEYFEVALADREVRVSQVSGTVLSQAPYPFVRLANAWSLKWHTGQGSILWSVILGVASLGILFFVVSGLAMSFKRLKRKKYAYGGSSPEDAEYILLVGSETRNTFSFARVFQKALTDSGRSVYLTDLNHYMVFPRATHLIIFTATYGDGEAPTNARKFGRLLEEIEPGNTLNYAVVGFGSLTYTHYCRYAVEVDAMLKAHPGYNRIVPLMKINEQSQSAFSSWIRDWNIRTGMDLKAEPIGKKKTGKMISFEIVEHSGLNVDNTAVIRLRPKRGLKFDSGDLLNIAPPGESNPRKYSIAKNGRDILLSVKWHYKGKCSTYLCMAGVGDVVNASLERNPDFHFPKYAPSVWMVANGTGIAPFLGMQGNKTGIPTKMLWGGRIEESFACYRPLLNGSADIWSLALSQIEPRKYVQNVLLEQKKEVALTLKDGGVFMLCGSLKMQESVLNTLEEIAREELNQPLSDFENNRQLLMDCY